MLTPLPAGGPGGAKKGSKRAQNGVILDHFGGHGSKSTPLGVDIGPFSTPFLANSVSQRPSRARARYIIGDTLSPIYLSMLGPHAREHRRREAQIQASGPAWASAWSGPTPPRPLAWGLHPRDGTAGGCSAGIHLRMGRSPNSQQRSTAEGQRLVHMHSMCTPRPSAAPTTRGTNSSHEGAGACLTCRGWPEVL